MEMERHLSFETGKSARVGDGFFDSDASYRNMAQLASQLQSSRCKKIESQKVSPKRPKEGNIDSTKKVIECVSIVSKSYERSELSNLLAAKEERMKAQLHHLTTPPRDEIKV